MREFKEKAFHDALCPVTRDLSIKSEDEMNRCECLYSMAVYFLRSTLTSLASIEYDRGYQETSEKAGHPFNFEVIPAEHKVRSGSDSKVKVKKKLKYQSLCFEYPTEIQENIDIFFSDLATFSHSSEMVMTWIERKNEWGGMVVIPHNALVKMVHSLLQPTSFRREPIK